MERRARVHGNRTEPLWFGGLSSIRTATRSWLLAPDEDLVDGSPSGVDHTEPPAPDLGGTGRRVARAPGVVRMDPLARPSSSARRRPRSASPEASISANTRRTYAKARQRWPRRASGPASPVIRGRPGNGRLGGSSPPGARPWSWSSPPSRRLAQPARCRGLVQARPAETDPAAVRVRHRGENRRVDVWAPFVQHADRPW